MPLDANNKWKSGQIRKKFLNKQTNSGRARKNRKSNGKSKSRCCKWCSGNSRRNARVANKIYFNQYCSTYMNSNCDYYQDTFDDYLFVSSDDEYSSYYDYDNVYENYLYYDQWKATNKRNTIQNTEDTNTLDSEDVHIDYMIEHTKYVNSIHKSNIRISKRANKPSFVSTNIEISIIAGKYNEYDFVKDKLYDDMHCVNLWTHVPMKLMNTILQNVSMTIYTKQKQNPTHLYLQVPIDCPNFFVPIYLTDYSSIYKHHLIPKLLQNNYLLRILKDYFFLGKNQFSKFQTVFNRHLSTVNFDLQQIVFEYIPSVDIITNVLCPFIGYSKGVQLNTNIQNIQLLDNYTQVSNDTMEIINEKYKSSLHYILYRKKLKLPKSDTNDSESDDSEKPACKLFSDSETDSGSTPEPLFLKYINGFSDDDSDGDDSDDDYDVPKYNTNVSFKQPYRFCRDSNLLDDDKERDEKWWRDVKYKRKKKIKYKIKDRVLVKYNKNGTWKSGSITEINKKGVTVSYDTPIERKTKWYSNRTLKWQYHTKTILSKFVYERKFGSHIKVIQKPKPHSKRNKCF